jgi:hypothetical protein
MASAAHRCAAEHRLRITVLVHYISNVKDGKQHLKNRLMNVWRTYILKSRKQCLKYTYVWIYVGCSPSFFHQSRLHSHMKGHVRSVENRSWTWRNCSLQMGDKEECQTCLVHVDDCLLACLKVCVVFFYVGFQCLLSPVCFYSSSI